MKNFATFALCSCMSLALSSCDTKKEEPKESPTIKVLFIGNSFALDTIEYLPSIALNAGKEEVKFASLYVPGCSINKHYDNAINNKATYEYYTNIGEGWKSVKNMSIRSALQSEEWDYVTIQHGTADGSRYADINSYVNLENLIKYVKENAIGTPKIVFNMTWVGEVNSHEELKNVYNNDTITYYNAIASLTKDHISKTKGLDIISPTGTAIQNARTADIGLLTSDGYHLSLTTGRYTAALTFYKALTNFDLKYITWGPADMDYDLRKYCVEAATNAIANPFEITNSTIK